MKHNDSFSITKISIFHVNQDKKYVKDFMTGVTNEEFLLNLYYNIKNRIVSRRD